MLNYIFGSDMDHSIHVSDEKITNNNNLKHFSWRFVNVLMAVFFAFAAFVQINDPDSVVWILLYAVPALLCLSLAIYPLVQGNWHFKVGCLVYSVVCVIGIIYSLYRGSDEILKHKSNVFAAEEAREAGGLAIVVSWLLMIALTDYKSINTMSLSSWMRVGTIALIPFLSALFYLYTTDMSQVPKHCSGIIKGL